VNNYDAVATAVRRANPWPEGASEAADEWSTSELLSQIEHRSESMKTIERDRGTKQPEGPRQRRGLLVAAAAAAVVVLVGAIVFALVANREGTDVVEPTPTTLSAPTTVPATTLPSPTTLLNSASPTPLTTNFGGVVNGAYRLDTFGTPITFTVDPSFFMVMENTTDRLALAAPNSDDPGDRDMVLARFDMLSDPAAPNSSIADQGEGWPANDFAGWLDNVAEGVVVVERSETTLGGLPATRAELRLGEMECFDSRYCALLGSRTFNYTSLDPGSTYVVWVVDDGAEDPLVVILSIWNEGDRAWLEAYEKLLATFVIGDQ